MRYVKFLLVPMLFVSLAFMNIGGCGDSGAQGGNVTPTDPPPTDAPPTGAPPTDPPPTQPPTDCMMPTLDTNFSNLIYTFVDPIENAVMGVSSDGSETIIVIVDSFGDVVTAISDVIGPSSCLIDAALLGQTVFDASGFCGRNDEGDLFFVADFTILGVEFVDLLGGICVSVDQISSTADVEIMMKEYHDQMIPNENIDPIDPFVDFESALNEFRQNGLIE